MSQCGLFLDHGVMLTGAYEDEYTNYWIIKNSMGAGWGESGYMKLDRSKNEGNVCQICTAAYYPEL